MASSEDTQRESERDFESIVDEHETHATTGGAVAAGAVTGGVIGLAGGPIGAAIGAVGGAIIGAASERLMHSDDDRERARNAPDHDHGHVGVHSDVIVERAPIARQAADTLVEPTSERSHEASIRGDDVRVTSNSPQL
ncbi:MAG: hypothetical protein NVSMB2_04740 [Chloroflexota bacterium]